MFQWYKKIIATFIIAIVAMAPVVHAGLEDVDSSASYYNAVQYLRQKNVIVETKLFKPDLVISRAEFIKYLVLINNTKFKSDKKVNLPFKDTRNSAWYGSYLQEALDLGIIDPNQSKIRPYGKMTIIDAIKLLFQSKSIPIPKKFVGEIPYKDLKNKKDAPLIMRAALLGIIYPEKPDYFGAGKRVTRAIAAQLIFRMEMLDLNSSLKPSNAQVNITTKTFEPDLQKIINVWEIIHSNYVNKNDLDKTQMSTDAINGLLKSIDDPYSTYLDKKANQNFSDEIEGKFEGIGAYISIEEGGNITIVSPIKDSPAYKAGVEAGDIIRKVDSFDTKGANLQEVVSKIKGPKGTDVKLTLERKNRLIEINVTRGLIKINAVEYEIIENGSVMMAKIITFNEAASSGMREVSQVISNNKDIKGLILDMRGNPGGLLDSAIDIISLFVPKDSPAVQIKYNYYNVTQSTVNDGILKNFPVVVLIDKGSASASEIVAGALQELIDATVVGETSFGKGTVQEVNFFEDNSSFKVTVAKWLTPKGRSIQGNGIKPDIEILRTSGETIDRQLDRAIIEINKKIK